MLCYDAPQFNIWRFWDKTMIDVEADGDWVPLVYGVSTDDIHGLVDTYIKGAGNGEDVDVGDLLDVASRAESAAQHREYGFGPLELLWECPPVWAPDQTTCTKEFSPFYKSCVAVTAKKGSAPEQRRVKVKAWTKRDALLPLLFLCSAILLRYAKPISEFVLLWYVSAMSLWVLVGLVILLVISARKFKVPGSSSWAFVLASLGGYGAAVGGFAKSLIRRLLVQYWEAVAIYCGLLALCGFIYVARLRSSEQRKKDFRVSLLWSLRIVALCILLGSTRSGTGRGVLLAVLAGMYCVARLFKRKDKSKTQ